MVGVLTISMNRLMGALASSTPILPTSFIPILSRMWAVAVAATTATMIKNDGKRIFFSWQVIHPIP